MSLGAGELKILKTDSRGRVRTPPEKREQILEEFERSGMSGSAFAALIGVKYSTFASWRQRGHRSRSRPRRLGSSSNEIVRLVEAQPAASGGGLELELPGAARMRITERSQVVLAVELLRGLASC